MSTAPVPAPDLHPMRVVRACLGDVEAALDALPQGAMPPADPALLERVIDATVHAETRLAELRLRLSQAAQQARVEEESAAPSTDAWLARLTGSTTATTRGGLWLARMLSERYPAVRAAFATGDLGEEQARIIVKLAEQMPDAVTDAERDTAVAALVEKAVALRLAPPGLRRLARRMLDRVSAHYADLHQKTLLQGEEDDAEHRAYLRMEDNGDGTWSGRFLLPDLSARMLGTVLEHLSSPRRPGRGWSGQESDPTVLTLTRRSWAERLGQAFVELCEHLPTDGLAQHGRNGATLVVHLDLEHLRDGLGAATVASTGDAGPGELSAGQARRLACEAGIIPAVLGGSSMPLDLGREQRLHSKYQRIALAARYDTCAAEGCERPFAWTEIHHPVPWSHGGRTDRQSPAGWWALR